MNLKSIFTQVLISGLALSLASPLYAQKMSEFSAEMVMTSAAQGSMQGKIYVADKKVRLEMMGNIVITRMDLNIAWFIMTAQNMYMEQAINPDIAAQTSSHVEGELERRSLGREVVNGYDSEKFLVRYTSGAGEQSIYQWITQENIPIQSAAVDGSWSMEYRHLVVGAQEASLFELPPGYNKFSMPNMADLQAMQAAVNS